jgi:hypothetical protein
LTNVGAARMEEETGGREAENELIKKDINQRN